MGNGPTVAVDPLGLKEYWKFNWERAATEYFKFEKYRKLGYKEFRDRGNQDIRKRFGVSMITGPMHTKGWVYDTGGQKFLFSPNAIGQSGFILEWNIDAKAVENGRCCDFRKTYVKFAGIAIRNANLPAYDKKYSGKIKNSSGSFTYVTFKNEDETIFSHEKMHIEGFTTIKTTGTTSLGKEIKIWAPGNVGYMNQASMHASTLRTWFKHVNKMPEKKTDQWCMNAAQYLVFRHFWSPASLQEISEAGYFHEGPDGEDWIKNILRRD